MSAVATAAALIFGLAGAALVGIGLAGVAMRADLLRRVIAVNILGAGIFLIFGAVARLGAGGGFNGDPVPQALVITGIVVAFAATALAVALCGRLVDLSGRPVRDPRPPGAPPERP